jgi:hypothetical protein
MYNPTNPGYSTQNQTRITPNYEPTISDNPYASSPYDLQKVPTPPKPPHVKNKIIFALGVVIVVLLVVISGLVFGLVYVNNKIAGNIPTPGPTVVATTSILSTPIQTPTKQTQSTDGYDPTKQTQSTDGYTANDVLNKFRSAGQVASIIQGASLNDWIVPGVSSNDLNNWPSIPPLSQVGFIAPYTCPPQSTCDPFTTWVGVYASADQAERVYNQLLNDTNALTSEQGTPFTFTHSRCVLLTYDNNSIIEQIITSTCT